jgi:hypothetical protein
MSSDIVVLIKLLFGLSCYVVVGSAFAWNALWADALGIDIASKGLVLPRVAIAILALIPI